MAIEIERKFLLADDSWRSLVSHSVRLAQGYLVGVEALRAGMARASVRVRVAGEQAWLNIKEAKRGIARAEYEVPVPVADAQAMLETLCDGVVEKIRHHVRIDAALFEIDEFLGANEGLVVAEVELPAVDASFPQPRWLGREVSALERYYNVNLITHPFARWSDAERTAMDGESF
jgi:adenylate cyclase